MSRRTQRKLIRLGLGTCLVTGLLWVAASILHTEASIASHGFRLQSGCIKYSHPTGLGGWSFKPVQFEWSGFVFLPRIAGGLAGTKRLCLPLWCPLAAILAPTFLLWRNYRRHPEADCFRCGYDLTGNVSGTCPECGRTLWMEAIDGSWLDLRRWTQRGIAVGTLGATGLILGMCLEPLGFRDQVVSTLFAVSRALLTAGFLCIVVVPLPKDSTP